MIFNKEWIEVSEKNITQQINGKRIIVFGASRRNDSIFRIIDKKQIECIFDNDEKKWGTIYEGLLIKKPEMEPNAVFLTTLRDYKNLQNQIKKLEISECYYLMDDELYFSQYQNYIKLYMQEKWAHVFGKKHFDFRYIHVFSDNKFFLPTVSMIEKAFDIREHAFIIYCFNRPNLNNCYGNWDKYKELSIKYGNITIIDTRENFYGVDNQEILQSVVPELVECNQILFHGEWMEKCVWSFFTQEKIFELVKEKGVWFPWSGNVGADKSNEKYIETLLKHCKIVACSYDFMYKHLCDRVVMPRHYRLDNGLSYAWITDYPSEHYEGKNILLGQACFRPNKNIESMKKLEKYKDEIDVYCITSYGDEDYIKETVAEGMRIFGDRFHVISKFLRYPEFVDFLNHMDVAVYGMEVSASYDTLQLLFWLKKKVYLKKGSDIDVMTRSYGYQIYDFYHIEEENLDEIFTDNYKEENFLIAQNEFDNDLKIAQWRELFEIDMKTIVEEQV